jgi:hypothetical protein
VSGPPPRFVFILGGELTTELPSLETEDIICTRCTAYRPGTSRDFQQTTVNAGHLTESDFPGPIRESLSVGATSAVRIGRHLRHDLPVSRGKFGCVDTGRFSINAPIFKQYSPKNDNRN